jgi:hypothetical protein
MSFQRIFEMVKRQGMPLIITDGQGKKPLIVLPLDAYEALLDSKDAFLSTGETLGENEPDVVPVQESAASQEVTGSAPVLDVASEQAPAFSRERGSEKDLISELSVEERFYIEPINNEEMG